VTAAHRSTVLFYTAMVLIGLSISTVLPVAAARVNDLGYHSFCPFVPWSPLALLLGAGLALAVRQYLAEQEKRDRMRNLE
jgi:hypothetical protein